MKIGLDVDYVLINFEEGFYKYFNKPYSEKINRDTFIDDNYYYIRYDTNFYLNLNAAVNPIYIDFDVECYITARDIPAHITYMSLSKLGFPKKPVFNVGYNISKLEPNSKSQIINDLQLDYFIDDSVKHFNEINNETNCTCFLKTRLNNEFLKTNLRLNHISEFNRLIENMQ